jgi:hypothetical protein
VPLIYVKLRPAALLRTLATCFLATLPAALAIGSPEALQAPRAHATSASAIAVPRLFVPDGRRIPSGARMMRAEATGATSSDRAWRVVSLPQIGDHNLIHDVRRDRYVVFGGTMGDDYTDAVWISPAGSHVRWQRVHPPGSGPSPRAGAASIYDPVRNRMVVFGGRQSDPYDRWSNEVWALSLDETPVWNRIQTHGQPPPHRAFACAVYDARNDRMFVIGGERDTTTFDDVWALDLATDTWGLVTAPGVLPSRNSAFAVTDSATNALYLIGGFHGGTPRLDAWKLPLSPDSSWRALAPGDTTGPPYTLVAAAWIPETGRIFVLGGLTDGLAWILDPAGGWSTMALTGPAGPGGRDGPGFVFDRTRGRILVSAGWERSSTAFYWQQHSDTWSLDPMTGAWSCLSDPAPSARARHGVALDESGDRFIVTGGLGNRSYLSDTWSFSLAEETWTRLASSGVQPPARLDPIVVVDPDQNQLLMYGGWITDTVFEDLWRLPLDSGGEWSPVSAANPPTGRRMNSAIYDPVRRQVVFFANGPDTMEVWALRLGSSPGWSLLPTVGAAPTSRSAALTVYDAVHDRVVLHGGSVGDHSQGDVWTLSLWDFRWRPLQVTNPYPPRRSAHAGVFDPVRSRLLVYGGLDIDSDLIFVHGSLIELDFRDDAEWVSRFDGGDSPGGNWFEAAVYDPRRNAIVLHGGFSWDDIRSDVRILPLGDSGLRAAWLLSAFVNEHHAWLFWRAAGGAGIVMNAERQGSDGEWRPMGTLVSDAMGMLYLFDNGVQPGESYVYRLTAPGLGSFGQVPVDIPGTMHIALRAISPNPTNGAIEARLWVPVGATPKLELFDLSGRILKRIEGPWTPGDHRVRLAEPGLVPAGVYLVRVTDRGFTATRKAVVVR